MKRSIAILLVLALCMVLCSCGAESAVTDNRLQVVATLFPYYDFARQIGGDDIAVTLLVPAGRETHSFEPTPLDVITVSQADVFLYNGGESEYWVEEILESAGEQIPTVLQGMSLLDEALEEEEIENGLVVTEADGDHEHEEYAHRHGHEQADGEEAEEYDEHIWTSPIVAMMLCRGVCQALCQADPNHADSFRQRTAEYLAQLTELDTAFRDAVTQGARTEVVFGDRFPLLYFAREYDLTYAAAFHGCSSDTEPSLATLKNLIDLVNEEDIPAVYIIELSSGKVADAIAETTGAKVLRFHSCQNVSRAEFSSGETYLSLMWKNVTALQEGLA